MFVYSLIAHMQKILTGLMRLAETENVAATAPICRHVFEWTALSCYLTRRLKELFDKHEWEEAWAFLTKAAVSFIDELLRLADESTVRPKARLLLDQLAAASRQAAARRQAAASSTLNGIIKPG